MKEGKRCRHVLHLASIDCVEHTVSQYVPQRQARHISIRKRRGINREDLDKLHVNNIYLFSDCSEASSEYASDANGYNYNRAKFHDMTKHN